ncbi:MAG TPA: hypothetical protein VF407_06345, partial [Polyangiaceae bacterium]
TVTLTRNGKPFASGKRPVDEKLRDLLAVDAKFFANVFYADQDELRKSFDLTPADRRIFVEGLIGQEIWRERVEGLRRTERHLRDFINDLATGRFGAFIEELDRLSDDASEDADELKQLDEDIAEIQATMPSKNRRGLRADEQKAHREIAHGQHSETALVSERAMLDRTIRDLAKGSCPTCTQVVPARLRRDRLADLRRRLRSIDSDLRKLEKTLARLNEELMAVDFDDLNVRFDELNTLEERRRGLSREQAKRVATEKRLRSQARVFGKKPEQHARAAAEATFVAQLIEVINDHRAGLRERVVKELVTAMNDLLSRFHDGDFDAEAIIDGELDLNVKLHGRQVPLTNLSGAAKDMFAIALRYGLMRVAARHVECLILDEPTRHMDVNNVRQLKAVFDEFADRQLIVVTIQGEFTDARGRHFTVTKDADRRSVVAT